jgi:hypothetical protein
MRRVPQKRNGRWKLRFLDHGRIRARGFRLKREAEGFAKLLSVAQTDREHFSQMLATGKVIGAEVPQQAPVKFEELADAWREAHLEGTGHSQGLPHESRAHAGGVPRAGVAQHQGA